MDASLLIGAPIGLGILLAFGIVMVAMAYLAQWGRTPAVCYSYPTRRSTPRREPQRRDSARVSSLSPLRDAPLGWAMTVQWGEQQPP